jgi:hypothetical protein
MEPLDLPDPEEESLRDTTANILPMELSGSTPIKQGGSAPNDREVLERNREITKSKNCVH